jgi:hypothetical protein
MYVRSGNLGRAGRLAGTHRVSSLGRLRGPQGWARRKALGFPNATAERMVNTWLGQADYGSGDTFSESQVASAFPITPVSTSEMQSSIFNPLTDSGGGLSPSGSGAISATNAALLSQAIATAGKVGTQAIIGSPSLTYNPATGTYTASGGAALPTGQIASAEIGTELTSFLPLLLIGGAVFLVISMARR